MRPVVTPEEMGVIDAEAPEPIEVLIERAGWAVARAARQLLGRSYGTRVVVVAGKGNNGADGRAAARHLRRRGCRVRVLTPEEAAVAGPIGQGVDLVIDAAYGTGFRGTNVAPDTGATPVLAVDIPSGVDGLTGEPSGSVLAAAATVTFAAVKPGLVFEPGRSLAGPVTVADIGLDCSEVRCQLLDAADLARWPGPEPTTHKWRRAVWVLGGSPGMVGAPALAARASARAGAGYVAVSIPGSDLGEGGRLPVEAVRRPLSGAWAGSVLADEDRFGALVLGPGLAVDADTGTEIRAVAAAATAPVVLDGGALDAIAPATDLLADRAVPAVLTPHDGEFRRLTGSAPGPDRIAAARRVAAERSAVVVLKGPTTVIAHPDGRAMVSIAGDARLATAGTGDVLAGTIGAALAQGLDPLVAASLGAELHGRAALRGPGIGLVAGDLPPLLAEVLAERPGPGR